MKAMRRLEDLSEEEVQEIQRGMDAWRESQIRPFKEPREFHGEVYEFDSAWAMRTWGGADARAENLREEGHKANVVAPHRFQNILRGFLGLRTHQWYIVYKGIGRWNEWRKIDNIHNAERIVGELEAKGARVKMTTSHSKWGIFGPVDLPYTIWILDDENGRRALEERRREWAKMYREMGLVADRR